MTVIYSQEFFGPKHYVFVIFQLFGKEDARLRTSLSSKRLGKFKPNLKKKNISGPTYGSAGGGSGSSGSGMGGTELHRGDTKRYAAVLVLREIACCMPTFFFQNVSQFFEVIFNAVWDPRPALRYKTIFVFIYPITFSSEGPQPGGGGGLRLCTKP